MYLLTSGEADLRMVVVVAVEVGSLDVGPVGQRGEAHVGVVAVHPVVSHVELDDLAVDVVAHGSVGAKAVEEREGALGLQQADDHVVEVEHVMVVLAEGVVVDAVEEDLALVEQLVQLVLPSALEDDDVFLVVPASLLHPAQDVGMGLADVVLGDAVLGDEGVDDAHTEADVEDDAVVVRVLGAHQALCGELHDVSLPVHHHPVTVVFGHKGAVCVLEVCLEVGGLVRSSSVGVGLRLLHHSLRLRLRSSLRSSLAGHHVGIVQELDIAALDPP